MIKDAILNTRVIAILRSVPMSNIVTLGSILSDAGVRLIEVSCTDEDAPAKIRSLRDHLPSETFVGAGTVLDEQIAARVRDAGAQYLITPHVVPDVIRYGVENGLPVIAGALTPTEILSAVNLGSEFVKVFPAHLHGPAYIKSLLGPYPDLKLIPVGGVGPDNMRAYLGAGAVAVGIGGGFGFNAADAQTVADNARSIVRLV